MPNWCYNKLIVKSNGDTDALQNFIEQGHKLENQNGSNQLVWRISNYFPTPLKYFDDSISEKNLSKEFGSYDLDEWREENWGTVSDCTDLDYYSKSDNCSFFEVEFDSAWSPPKKWLIHVKRLFPTLSFKIEYLEPGINFCGVLMIENDQYIDICIPPVYVKEGNNIEYKNCMENFEIKL